MYDVRVRCMMYHIIQSEKIGAITIPERQ